MRLIDLDDYSHHFCGHDGEYEKWNIDPDAIVPDAIVPDAIVPAIEPEPKKGMWYEHYSHEDGERDGVRCSECGTHYYFGGQLMNYCPNCGADMREGD